MASRKTKRKNMMQFLGLILAVALVVVVSVLFQNWWNSRPDTPPEEVSVKATVNDQELEVFPYSMCTPGIECEENDIPKVTVGEDDTIHLEIPEDIHDHDWALLKIYDNPAANDETYFTANQQTAVDIPASVGPLGDDTERPKLIVVEINSVMIGQDENGEETPYSTTWSLSTNYSEDYQE